MTITAGKLRELLAGLSDDTPVYRNDHELGIVDFRGTLVVVAGSVVPDNISTDKIGVVLR